MANGLQNTSYTYNERGWLRNNSSSQFSFQLHYQDDSIPQYNGNISGQLWGAGTTLGSKFVYNYDKINRLLSGSGTGMSEIMTYDPMGNITTLTRDGIPRTNSYNGNQYISGTGTGTYQYDGNGNATYDGRNAKTITYNILNLPMTVSGGNALSYLYDATGNKLKKIVGTNITDYISGIQYTNGAIDIIQTETGLARNNGGNYSYEYNLTDHLGNVRYSFHKNPLTGLAERLQSDDYYPFGLRKSGSPVSVTNKYLYNGKEIQDELGQYDYGARFYDPVIGRFNTVDPLSEKSRRFSPYVYGNNNPISFIDPDGMETESIHLDKYGKILGNYNDGDKGVYVHENAQSSKDYKKDYSVKNTSAGGEKIGEIGGKLNVDKIYANLLAKNTSEAKGILSPWTFKSFVTDGGKWDLKADAKSIFGFGNDGKTTFEFQGNNMESQDIGNHHFGVVAEAIGIFPEEMILRQAGKNQMSKPGHSLPQWQKYHTSTSLTPYGNTTSTIMLPPYGNDPRDQAWIISGFNYFKTH